MDITDRIFHLNNNEASIKKDWQLFVQPTKSGRIHTLSHTRKAHGISKKTLLSSITEME